MIETIVLEYLNQALDGEAQIGIANANLVYQAQQGTDSFEGYPNELPWPCNPSPLRSIKRHA